MTYSLDDIKSFRTIDLDNFEIRGAKTGVNNALSTGPLYDRGIFIPSKTVFTGSCDTSSGDTTVTNIHFNSPFSFLNGTTLIPKDLLIIDSSSFIIQAVLDSSKIVVTPAPSITSSSDTTFNLAERNYLVEPDINHNTTRGSATFTNDSTDVLGLGTQWLTDLTSGDIIQCNTYQKYFTIVNVFNNTNLQLNSLFTGPTVTEEYTAKKWRLGRLAYQYVKDNFDYDKLKALWTYDSTTGSNLPATADWTGFRDGIELKFSPTLNPSMYPDLMDSNVTLNTTLSQGTEYDSYQFPLPAVPDPEESLTLSINGISKNRFSHGNGDYIINYSQLPTYQTPPAPDQRTVANLMFLASVQDATLANTGSGILTFVDRTGNQVSGIMPGSETITIDGTVQIRDKDYVIDADAGLGYLSEIVTNEKIVSYIMVQKLNLYDLGLTISLNGVPQVFTIPHKDTDDILFDTESGRLKPTNKDNPGHGEEYLVTYYVEGEYIDSELIAILYSTTWVRAQHCPIKPQSLILSKNGVLLDEGIDYRVSYLTGRIVFFSSLISGDGLELSYSPLVKHKNGISYENDGWYCTVYDSTSAVATSLPISFTLSNSVLADATGFSVQKIYNATQSKNYNISGYTKLGLNVAVISDSTNTSFTTALTDTVLIDYKFENSGTEFMPVETLNFIASQGTNYLAFINQDLTGTFLPGYTVRLTNVDSAGDFYFCDASAVYDGEDTVVYLTGNIPQDIINPDIYLSDSSVSFRACGSF